MAASGLDVAVGFEWTPFTHGFVFWEYSGPEHRPPPDEASRREWLEGFLQARADYPDEPHDPDNPDGGETAADALRRTLAGQCDADALLALLDRMLAEWWEAGNGGGCGRETDLSACSSEPQCLDGIRLKKAVAFLS